MTAVEVLAELERRRIELFNDNGQLRYRAPRGVITSETVSELSRHKAELLKLLRFLQSDQQVSSQTKSVSQLAPLSFAQERLWFLHQLDPSNSTFNSPTALDLDGPVDTVALLWSLNEIMRRHEILRTTFPSIEGQPVQAVIRDFQVVLPIIDLSELQEAAADAEARLIAMHQVRRPFTLSQELCCRFTLFRLAPDHNILVVVVHHIVWDGWSRGTFLRELSTLYRSFVKGVASPSPELPIQYSDFAVWQRQWLRGEVLERHLSYWKEKLILAPRSTNFPVNHPKQSPTLDSKRRSVALSVEVVAKIDEFIQRHNISLFMLMLTALDIVLYKWTGQSDIVIGTVIANRKRAETEDLIGCFIELLPLRSKMSANQTSLQLLDQVKTTVLEAYAHQDCPLGKIANLVRATRTLRRSPLYNVAFLMQNSPRNVDFGTRLTCRQISIGRSRGSLLDLKFVALTRVKEVSIACEYRESLFGRETVEVILQFYCDVLSQIVADPLKPIAEFGVPGVLQSKSEEQRVLPSTMTKVVGIAGTFTVEPIRETLEFWFRKMDLQARIQFGPFNQIIQQLLDPESILSRNENGVNVLFIRLDDWINSASEAEENPEKFGEDLKYSVSTVVEAMKFALDRSSTPYLICLCPASRKTLENDLLAGNFNLAQELLFRGLKDIPGVYLVTLEELTTVYPVEEYDDPRGDLLGKIPFTEAFFASLGTMVARKICGILNPARYKVIVLDCDGTLWNGLCGEDGPFGIQITPPFKALQEFMVGQQEAGMLICLCSKNNEDHVAEVFECRLEMPLKREHIMARRINWKAKSDNIRSLSEELNLGLDSFIFIDDSPIECAEVEAHLPDVLILRLPENSETIPAFLKQNWAFDHLRVTEEDKNRSTLYRQHLRREQVREESPSFEEFLSSLELQVDIRKATVEEFVRVSELTRRTNQFNFMSVKRSEYEIEVLMNRRELDGRVVVVKDRFGDYGLVGVLLFKKCLDALEVDTFLLSCRALGRRIEHRMVARLGEIAQDEWLEKVVMECISTGKNAPALEFLEAIGRHYKEAKNGRFRYVFPAEYARNIFSLSRTAKLL